MGGSVLLCRLALKRPATIPELVERVDMELAQKLCSIAENRDAHSLRIRLRAVGSIWRVIGQMRLLAGIVIEIRKEQPLR